MDPLCTVLSSQLWFPAVLTLTGEATVRHSAACGLSREILSSSVKRELFKHLQSFKWFGYFSVMYCINKSHGGHYKQHPPFTET